jgi:hypothetical protein
MSTPSNGPETPLTPQQIDAWLRAAKERRAALHTQATAPRNSHECHEAFTEMSDLLQQALEEVRMVSEALREGCQVVRGESADLWGHSTQLMERGKMLVEHMAQFVPPPPQEVHEAERQLLERFKGGHRQEDS